MNLAQCATSRTLTIDANPGSSTRAGALTADLGNNSLSSDGSPSLILLDRPSPGALNVLGSKFLGSVLGDGTAEPRSDGELLLLSRSGKNTGDRGQ